MKLQDVLPKMSKMYLSRIIDSFLKDVKIKEEEEMRQVILKNIDEFQNEDRVKRNLNFLEEDRDIALLNEMILMSLMENEGYVLEEASLLQDVEKLESQIVSDSDDEEFIKGLMTEEYYRIYSSVLSAAWKKDETLNAHETNILRVLRTELNISKRNHYIVESRIGRFPQKGNRPHSHRQIEKSLRNLQSRGLILRFKSNAVYYIIPSEIARVIRYELGGELRKKTYEELLGDLTKNHLKHVVSQFNFNSSGSKETIINRILKHDILPSEALDTFSNKELTDILKNLEGVNISGKKEQRISNIIDYYENLSTSNISDPTDKRSLYYDYFEELAARNLKPLRVNKVIKKDLDTEKYFEEATRYLFEEKLGVELVNMSGNKHADGKIKFNSKESILWDNKSVESAYTFPDNHFDQFLNYIRANDNRVTAFIIITSFISDEAVSRAQKLKAYTETDTDVAIITSEDLKFVAENWKEYSTQKEPKFNLQILNYTGELTREILKDRMSWSL
ncbi:hypothetical protein HUG15_11655 [Salicibibacter cibarius]|uniref:SAP domain-containing protein n=1 Tax=Salicibibacter cibarius TaxID=2743000 RepID=A0A7T6Z3K9_9BACI|nr:hypothetical protein [Salicibibacter cibarius]QQK76146.1 hypothetical protein HUG15_11655 [Salicibibacter cibarius]